MDVFDEEIVRFWKALQDNSVEYILVGGYAIIFHGYERFTGDLDLWLKDTLPNRKALRKAFNDCEMGDFPMIERMQFVPGWTQFYLNNSMQLDILTDMKGLEDFSFEECLRIASVAEIEGVSVPFLHINQLITNKKFVNRPKDQIDVLMLEEIRRLTEDNTNNS